LARILYVGLETFGPYYVGSWLEEQRVTQTVTTKFQLFSSKVILTIRQDVTEKCGSCDVRKRL
jgi:hypothetical protein